jgi:hypothetical protein
LGHAEPKVGNPQSLVHSVLRIYYSVNHSRVEYTSMELRQIALEQIRVLPARLEISDRGSDRPSSSHTHSPRLSILSHHPTLNLRTNISLPRPPRCIIVTHKVHTYTGLFILIGRATDFHIGNVFRVNYKIVWKCNRNTTQLLPNSIIPHSPPLQFSKRKTHIHDISNTYVPFPQLFAKGKSLKSEGMGMPRDKNNGLLSRNWAMSNQLEWITYQQFIFHRNITAQGICCAIQSLKLWNFCGIKCTREDPIYFWYWSLGQPPTSSIPSVLGSGVDIRDSLCSWFLQVLGLQSLRSLALTWISEFQESAANCSLNTRQVGKLSGDKARTRTHNPLIRRSMLYHCIAVFLNHITFFEILNLSAFPIHEKNIWTRIRMEFLWLRSQIGLGLTWCRKSGQLGR